MPGIYRPRRLERTVLDDSRLAEIFAGGPPDLSALRAEDEGRGLPDGVLGRRRDHPSPGFDVRRGDARAMLLSTRAPEGPIRFDMEADVKELAEHQDLYGLRENAARLADRSILLIGGWEDAQVTVDQYLLPLYRTLKRANASDVTFLVYHDDHGFSNVRGRSASDIRDWLLRKPQ